MVRSVGFTRRTCVRHPPPSAKCGSTIGVDDEEEIGITGRVVIKNSERSLVYPRRSITPTGIDDENVNVRASANGRDGRKGVSVKNAAICEFPPTIVVPSPKFTPTASVK